MRYFYISLLALLPFMGLPLSAAVCHCAHAEESTEDSIDAVSCCQELPDSCCVKTERDPQPKTPLAVVAPQADSFSTTLIAIATLTEERAICRPQAGSYSKLARPPPLDSGQYRCHLQSWLI